MIADIDKDESGSVDFSEFVDMMTGRMVRCCSSSSAAVAPGLTAGCGSVVDRRCVFVCVHRARGRRSL